MKKILFVLFTALIFMSSCDDNEVKIPASKCVDGCKDWEKCDEANSVCVLKDGRCDTDKTENCKDDTPMCNEETHTCVASDKCNPNPCIDVGRTKCELSELEVGYVCNCDEGFELKDDVCVEKNPCDPNPCTDENKTRCQILENSPSTAECLCDEGFKLESDKCVAVSCENECTEDKCMGSDLQKCELNTATGCKELSTAVSCGFNMKCEENSCVCDNACDENTEAKCMGSTLVTCVKNADGCFSLNMDPCTDGCDDTKDEAFCTCKECVVEEFNSACHDDNLGFTQCKDTNGCFTIETVDCGAGEHCSAESGLSCVDNTCSDDEGCSDAGFLKCKSSGGASIIVNCEQGADGCFHYVDGKNCTSLNMECNVEISDCLGGNGNDRCGDATKEILSSGLWYGSTKDMDDDYSGCTSGDKFNGKDTVYKIELATDNILKIELKERDAANLSSVKPSIYVRKACDEIDDTCKKNSANDSGEAAKLNYKALSDGTYYIIIDRKKSGFTDITQGYDFEMNIHLN